MEEWVKSSSSSDDGRELGNTRMMECGVVDEVDGQIAEFREMGDTQLGGSSESSRASDQEPVEEVSILEVDDEAVVGVNASFSVLSFLKKVLVKEVGDAAGPGGNHKLLVIAVHAVLLESGFVGYDPDLGMEVDGFHLPDEWPSSDSGISFHYMLPKVSTSEVVETVVLKFEALGKFVNVYGSLPRKGFGVHQVCLDEARFVPALSYVWNNGDCVDCGEEKDGSMNSFPKQEIFEFWKIIKDRLSYPLLIDLRKKVDLVPPPSFIQLPKDLKLKILKSLCSVDVGRVECVCSELRLFVASSNHLWRMKYKEEFGNDANSRSKCHWKAKFCFAWELRKKRRMMYAPLQWRKPRRSRPLIPR